MAPEHPIAPVPGSGADVLLQHDGTGFVRTASGRFLRLRNPPPGLTAALSGAPPADGGTAGAYAERLAAETAEREDGDAERRWPAARRNTALVGAGAPADALAEALAGWGAAPARFPGAAELIAAGRERPWDLVIGYADSPGERAHWDLLDALPGRGTAWLRGYREGEVCYVDPIAVSPGDPTAEQVRRRRLAASPAPRGLDAWQRASAAPARELPRAARTLLEARILTVALAWARRAGALDRYRGTLWRLAAATGEIGEHPVLAYDPPPPLADRAS
ncbi:hypothetical protein [Nocardiopsis potens]|uniref:hypothetical protein n=1 Tax=Nocardiopsis potens TaxID=1246458 RepID=UPI00036CD487|nr:hypothetical protein [Nocardiopsis potens]